MPCAEAGQRGGGGRPLQGQQCPIVQQVDRGAPAEMVAQMGEIGRLAVGVDDDEKFAAQPGRRQPGRHQIIEDAARIVEQQCVAHPHRTQRPEVAGDQRFERRGRVGAGEAQLAHMRDVEQPGLGAGVQMLGHDARGILHRHLVAGERHHAGAQRLVQRVERCALERRYIVSGHPRPPAKRTRVASPMPPLSWTLRDSPGSRPVRAGDGLTPSVSGGAATPIRCFPERPSARSPFA